MASKRNKATAQAVRQSPAAWAASLNTPDWHHAAAAALHNWALCEHHTGAPIELTEEAYLGACTATVRHVVEPGVGARSVPHSEALFEIAPAVAERELPAVHEYPLSTEDD